jgi:hypothetical protein
MSMRRAWLGRVVVLATAVGGLGLVAPTGPSASCVGPQIAVGGPGALPGPGPRTADQDGTPVVLRPGDDVTVSGRWFFRGCHDTGASTGCSAPDRPPPEKPSRGVRLVLVQGSRSWVLGTADAGGARSSYRARWEVTVPNDVGTGPALLRAKTAEASVSVLG